MKLRNRRAAARTPVLLGHRPGLPPQEGLDGERDPLAALRLVVVQALPLHHLPPLFFLFLSSRASSSFLPTVLPLPSSLSLSRPPCSRGTGMLAVPR